MTKILFVDDQGNVLSALRRMLHGFRKEWDMQFAQGGQEAIELLEEFTFDVVVTDMRMPSIDGAELLRRVRQRWPAIVRIVLSGQSELERIYRAVGPTHVYLSKPCDAERITDVVSQSCDLRERLPNSTIKQLISQLDRAPCQVSALAALEKELRDEAPSIDRVGEIIASDIGMTAKILQLVSSSFFGQPKRVASPEQAVSLLGVELLRELVLSVGIFEASDFGDIDGFSVQSVTEHSNRVAEFAKHIAEIEGQPRQVACDSWFAGKLHLIGKLMLAHCLPAQYRHAVQMTKDRGITLWQAEMETFGASHAEVGSYLLSLWGAPRPICEAVYLYRTPGRTERILEDFRPITAVLAANLLTRTEDRWRRLDDQVFYASETILDPQFLTQMAHWHAATQAM
ncbi:HDOD domain-containing protein [Blastopirellula retiformator]|uniref:Hydrogenase transcriptional regulatory protein hupR1 n=1 Tax=Blastopirellula retiformator TaxID=2527970 RepID=A0A5C5V9C0_9BACT|nr:HDOD domain-containing protein [Blastopirellula retiformator]TWT34322.1 Hydrogenase transcriptional regulatory protein hupR1 [Blastopirellula retiformator]